MSGQLVYETTDPDFADRVVSAMRAHHIPCYRVGSGYRDREYHFPGLPTESQVCIYIEHDHDVAAANRVLIEHGAIVEKPLRWWRVAGMIVVVAAAILLSVALMMLMRESS